MLNVEPATRAREDPIENVPVADKQPTEASSPTPEAGYEKGKLKYLFCFSDRHAFFEPMKREEFFM